MIITKRNKIILEPSEEQFLKDNFFKTNNSELAKIMGLKVTKLRHFAYGMGLKKIEMEYWTIEQIKFLKNNYQKLGDTEIAEIFSERYPKNKGWSKKHIEKKRRYLKLKRTASELKAIHKRNVNLGRFAICNIKMWETRGITPEGQKRIWFNQNGLPYLVIKTKKGFVHYNRWLWEKEKGAIPPGTNVCQVTGDRFHPQITDFKLMTDAELAIYNSKNRIPPELKEAFKINRQITKYLNKNTNGK